MKSQLLKLQQHQERCLIDWNERKGPVDARTKAMEKRIRNLKTIEETFDEVQSQKDEVKVRGKVLFKTNTIESLSKRERWRSDN